MSTSGHRLISLRSSLLLLFSLFLFCLSNAEQNIRFSCFKRGRSPHIAVFVEIKNEIVHNIYGKGAKDTCGINSAYVVRQGKGKTYRLLVNLTGVENIKPGVCGVVKQGNIAEMSVITRTSRCALSTVEEKETKIKCVFSRDLNDSTVLQSNRQQIREKENIDINFHFGGSPTELLVGAKTSLEMKVTKLTRFTAIVPSQCWVLTKATDKNKMLLMNEYGPVKDAPVQLQFLNVVNNTLYRSVNFPAFRYKDSDHLLIQCIVNVCSNSSLCHSKKLNNIKKRDAGRDIWHQQLVNAEVIIVLEDKKEIFVSRYQPLLGGFLSLSVFFVFLFGILVVFKIEKRNSKQTNVQTKKNNRQKKQPKIFTITATSI